MSERKVLNKYYPPDFDPSKIPRAKCGKNRQFTVRLMAPCNMKCYTCGEYIAQGKKFNARKEDVEDLNYLGIRIYRFYIKCPGCISEISFRTDPESTDYIIEAGAHRNFQALKLAEEQASKEATDAQNEIESNPMLLLENRTQQSQYEMELMESLEDLKELNDRNARIDSGKIALDFQKQKKLTAEQIEAAERLAALKALGYELIEGKMVKRLKEDSDDSDTERESLLKKRKLIKVSKGSDILTNGSKPPDFKSSQATLRAKLSGLVKLKPNSQNSTNKCNDISNKHDNNLNTDSPSTKLITSITNSAKSNTNSSISSQSNNNVANTSREESSTSGSSSQSIAPKSLLSSLCAYSDSESNED